MDWETVRAVALQAGGVLLISLIAVFIIAIVGGVTWLYLKNKRYSKYKVFIWKTHKDKNNKEIPVFVEWDNGAVIKDRKLKKWVFHLRKNNLDLGEEETESLDEIRDLDVPTIPCENGGQMVFVEKLGPRKFGIGKPFIFSGNVKVIVSAADCAEAIRSYDTNAKYFYNDKWKWAGPIAFAVFAVLIIVLFAVLLNKFDVIKESMQIAEKIATINQAGAAVPSSTPG